MIDAGGTPFDPLPPQRVGGSEATAGPADVPATRREAAGFAGIQKKITNVETNNDRPACTDAPMRAWNVAFLYATKH